MTDRRVCFDFEIEFSNGGGLQGQAFRLDIDGDDVSDAQLAARLVADMRLLMVGAIRIRNKRIVAEPHKRGRRGAADPVSGGTRRCVELSHVIESGMVTYRGLPAPLICDHLSFADSRAQFEAGTEFTISRVEMVGNTGTYLDTPYHRYADGDDLAALPLDRVSSLPGVVVRVTGQHGRAVDWTAFAATEVRARAVLVHTGWDAHWRTDRYFEDAPFLTEAAALFLRDRGARLVGIDSMNIDDTSQRSRPVHSVLLRAGIPIVEHLTNLGALPIDGFEFHAAPPKVAGCGTFPVRAHAVLRDAVGTAPAA